MTGTIDTKYGDLPLNQLRFERKVEDAPCGKTITKSWYLLSTDELVKQDVDVEATKPFTLTGDVGTL